MQHIFDLTTKVSTGSTTRQEEFKLSEELYRLTADYDQKALKRNPQASLSVKEKDIENLTRIMAVFSHNQQIVARIIMAAHDHALQTPSHCEFGRRRIAKHKLLLVLAGARSTALGDHGKAANTLATLRKTGLGKIIGELKTLVAPIPANEGSRQWYVNQVIKGL